MVGGEGAAVVRVVCFSPNDAVWRWTLPQAQFLEALQQRGDEIIYVYCDREYSSFCMSMASSGVRFSDAADKKKAICDRCVVQSDMVRSQLNFEGRPLRSFLRGEDIEEADRLSRDAPMETLYDHVEHGLSIGRLALYETIIQTKSISRDLSPDAQDFYRSNFRNTLISVRAGKAMLDELKPDIGISYHTAYAYNRAFQRVFEAGRVPVWFLNASMNVAELDSHLIAAKSDPEVLFRKMLDDWPRFEDVVCSAQDFASAADHLLALMGGGGFGYSNSMRRGTSGVLERLGCAPGKRVVAALLSSYDELLAAELAGFGWTTHNEVFSSQIEWVKWLFDFARARPDIHLVVRVHPREFAVNGIGERSEHSYLLEAAFSEKPENASINLPSDGIAIYDLLMEVDVALIAWSSAGMDAGMLGVPVVTYAGDVLLFPRQLTYDAKSREDYARFVDQAIDAGWSFERSRAFFRWAVLMMARTRIDMTNGAKTPTRQGALARLARRVSNRALLAMTSSSREQLGLRRRPRRLDDSDRIYSLLDRNLSTFYDDDTALQSSNRDQETSALKRQLGRLADFIEQKRGIAPEKLNSVIYHS
ncbi:hypothetical protein HY68_37765 [Streptomyces sp. AcH 505]|uniref:hypothetical protein n=1 Tax=Streptomyces sp. AcH 505 TaxID=352211 RepID=UPI000591FC7C|nr:hypothetical protein HY68_37765 [Streptomyces sp. AcH 505]